MREIDVVEKIEQEVLAFNKWMLSKNPIVGMLVHLVLVCSAILLTFLGGVMFAHVGYMFLLAILKTRGLIVLAALTVVICVYLKDTGRYKK